MSSEEALGEPFLHFSALGADTARSRCPAESESSRVLSAVAMNSGSVRINCDIG